MANDDFGRRREDWVIEDSPFIRGTDITERKKMEATANLQRYMQQKKAERSAT